MMKNSALIFTLCGAAVLAAMVSCAGPYADHDALSPSDEARAAATFSVSSISPASGATSVALSDSIVIKFSSAVASSTATASSIIVTRNDTGAAVSGTISLDSTGTTLTFKPIFQTTTSGTSIVTSGLKPGVSYKVVIAASVAGTNGAKLTAASTTTFTTANLDYGIYWFGSDGKCQKAVSGVANPYYDAAKPTVVFCHGWESGSSAKDYWREVPYVWNDSYTTNTGIGAIWRNAGWNIGVFYWNQFSDEGEVKDAEAKIWAGANGCQGMRYRLADGSYVSYSTAKSASDLFYDCYVSALSGNTSGNIRLVGHSLGNQIATACAWKVCKAVAAGTVSSSLLPNRIALLDPFWSKGNKSYIGNIYTGEQCRNYVDYMIATYGVVIENAKTTLLGGTVTGDDNVGMRQKTAFFRVWPDFISSTDIGTQHSYAELWYFWSMSSAIAVDGGALGAAASNSVIKSMMNYGKSSYYYWYDTGACTKTATPLDDTFTRASGVSTW